MELTTVLGYLKLSGWALGSIAVFYGFYKWNLVKKSIGWKMVDTLGKVKLGIGGNDIVLRIKSPTGKEYYETAKHSPYIEYEFFTKGKKCKKGVIYDERAVDSMNGIKILNVTPNDIRPIDRETGLLVNIPSELIEKLAVDSSKTAENEAMKDKQMKMLIYGLVGMAVLFIVALSYINTTNSELQVQLAQCTINSVKSAIVTTG